jgi:serine/threonine protein phosphatase PrpC
MSLDFIVHETSLIGTRTRNEDQIAIVKNVNGRNDDFKRFNSYGVFDGHGGAKVSAYLKDKLIPFFMDVMTGFEPSTHSVCNNNILKIYEKVQRNLEGFQLPSRFCGSTALVLLQYPNSKGVMSKLKIINLGDCRAVLCNASNIAIPLTKDHKPMSWDENKRIERMGGQIVTAPGDDPRINGLSVSRAFGDLDAKPHVSHEPDIYDYVLDVHKNNIIDRFIILACDGVWDVLSNQEAVDFILFTLDNVRVEKDLNTKTIKNVANSLGEYALRKGSQDNISIAIIFLQ